MKITMRETTHTYTSLNTLVLFIAFLLLPLADAQALDIAKRTAANSLPVVQVERHNLPVVMVTLLVKASPLDEKPEKAGLAYLTAKMLTEGTTHRSAAEFSEDVEFLGASVETSAAGDFTIISLSVLKKDADKGFDLLSDLLLNPAFTGSELARKKELIKGALRQREEDPAFVTQKAFIKEVFGNHAYGRLVEGSVETIDRISRDDVVNFYHEHYLPGNAILSVVGDLTPHELDTLLQKHLSAWKGKQKVSRSRETTGAKQGTAAQPAGVRLITIDKDITQANISLGHPGIARDNPDYYAVSVMNYILGGGGFASRLMRVIRDEMGLTYGISSAFIGNKEPGQFETEVQTKSESAGAVVQEILKQIRKIRTEPVTDRELEDAKAYLTGSFPRRFETSRKVADFLAAVQFYQLGDDYIEKYPGYINSVTKEEVLRAAQKYLHPDSCVLVVVGNQKAIRLPDLKTPQNMQ
jgi:zinc protease